MAELEQLDPRNLIDRKAEQDLFRDLVTFSSSARMLIISDSGGSGKSELLRRLEYNCLHEIKPPIPASYIDLKELKAPQPFDFVAHVIKTMNNIFDPADPEKKKKFKERFVKFNMLDEARFGKNFSKFSQSYERATVQVNVSVAGDVARSANVSGVGNVYVQTPSASWTGEQEVHARAACVDAFLDDLRAICETQPLVLILDAWELCDFSLRNWFNETLLADKNLQPKKLAVVVGGRSYDPSGDSERSGLRSDEFKQLFDDEQGYMAHVISQKAWSDWDKDHVRELFIQLGSSALQIADYDITYAQEKLKQERNLWLVIALQKILVEKNK